MRRGRIVLFLCVSLAACSPYDDEFDPPPPVLQPTPEVIVDPTAPDGGQLYVLVRGTAGAQVETYSVQQEQMLDPLPLEGQPVAIAVDRVDGTIASADPQANLVRVDGRAINVPAVTDVVFTPRRYTCCGPQFLLFAAGASGIAGFSYDSFAPGSESEEPYFGYAPQDELTWPGGASAVAVSPDGLRVAAALASATSGEVALLQVYDDVELLGDVFPMMNVDSCGAHAEAIAITETHLVAWDPSCDTIHDLHVDSHVWKTHSIPTDGVHPAHSRSALAVTHDGTTSLVLTSSSVWAAPIGGISPPSPVGALPGKAVAIAASLGDRAWIAWQDGSTPHLAAVDLAAGSLSTAAGFVGGTGEILDLAYRDLPPQIQIDSGPVLAGDVVELGVWLSDPDGDEIHWDLSAPYDAVPDYPGRSISYRSRCSKFDSTVHVSAYAQSGKLRVPYSGEIIVQGRSDCHTRATDGEVSGIEFSCNAYPQSSGVRVFSMLPILAGAIWLRVRRRWRK